MNPVINHLLQLQELTLIRDEKAVTSSPQQLKDLDASIAAMIKKLPSSERVAFLKLHKKDHVVMVPATEGVCPSCGMKLPISLIQSVRVAESVQACPSCARMLYYQESAPKRLGKTIRRRSTANKPGISRFSSMHLMSPSLEAVEKADAIGELSAKMEEQGFIDNSDRFARAALQREMIVSTAVDHAMAFPHVRGVEGGGLALALGISRKGIRFDDSQKQLTRLIFLVSIPTAASAFYLKLLAGLTQTFRDAEARKILIKQKTEEDVWETLLKLTKTTVK